MNIKNLEITINGLVSIDGEGFIGRITATITNDKIGKTLSLATGDIQISIPFEKIEEYLK